LSEAEYRRPRPHRPPAPHSRGRPLADDRRCRYGGAPASAYPTNLGTRYDREQAQTGFGFA
jgi:hypothetical protein